VRVLVTGHTGYIGSRLTPMLLEAGHEVTGLDTDLFRDCTFVGELADVPHIHRDVRDVTIEDLTGFDAVIHLAALSNDPLGDYDPSLTVSINEEGSIRVAELAKKAGVSRFLFASSCSNYGAAGQDFMTEDSPLDPITPYGVSKVAVEKALGPMADESFCPVYLRASTAYGVSPRLRFDLVLNNLTAWAMTTGKVLLKSDGSPWRPVVHVDDICRAYIALLEAPADAVSNRAFNIGTTTENYQIRDLAETVAKVVPNCEVSLASDAAPDKRCYRVDCNRIAREVPGFKPQWTIARGAEQLYETYRQVGLSLDAFEGPQFQRIAHVKQLIAEGKLDTSLRWTEAAKTESAA
jgi:nucleoside-diphosphate-sugar epimerase